MSKATKAATVTVATRDAAIGTLINEAGQAAQSMLTKCKEAAAKAAGIPAVLLGYAGGQALVVEGLVNLPLAELRAVHEAWLPTYMNSAA